MSEKIANIAKNTSYFTIALILQKVLSFTYFTLLARNLGPEDLGKYYFAISFTTIFAIFIDLGLTNVLTREVAKAQDNADKLLSNVLAIKFPLTIISFVTMAVLVNVWGYGELVRQLVYISSISMILDSFTASFYAISRGFHNLFFESIGSVIFQVIVLLTGMWILKENLGLNWLIGVLASASIFNFLYSLILVRKQWKVRINWNIDRNLIKIILKIAAPFAIYGIFQRLYTYFDSVLLSMLAGDKYVGLYQVAFKIIFALQFLPSAFIASLYPAMSAYWLNNREQLGITFERAMNYLIIISIPISIGIISIADKVVLIFSTGYGESVLPLQISMLALPFIFLAFPVGSLLNACDKQRINTIFMGIVLALSVGLNLILIPRWQAVGASVTVLITNLLMLVLGMSVVPKITPYRSLKIFKVFLKSLLAALIMALVSVSLKPMLNVFMVVVISGFVYFLMLFLFKGFQKEDLSSILKSFSKNNKALQKQ